MDEIQNDIFVRAISLQGMRDKLEIQCDRMEQNIGATRGDHVTSMDAREQDVLAKLMDMLIRPSKELLDDPRQLLTPLEIGVVSL